MIELASEVADERHSRRRDAAEDAIRESPLHALGQAGLRPVHVLNPGDAYQAASALIADRLVTAISIGTDSLIAPVLQAMYDATIAVGAGISLLVETHPSLSFLAHNSRADGRHFARRLLVELGVHDLPEGPLGHDGHGAHWRFLQRASVTTSARTPTC
jgi:DNA-binding LacI/PurR family transcriptional regulator